jgi:hypothetical protein
MPARMRAVATVIFTLIGLAVTLAGVGCGIWALVLTWTEHGSGALWPLAGRVGRWLRTAPQRLFGRPAAVPVSGGDQGSFEEDGHVDKQWEPLPADAPMDAVIGRLVERLDQLESDSSRDRARYKAGLERARAESAELGTQLGQARHDLEALTRSVAVSTARLQIIGLILVGIGTTVMALPTLL